MPAQQTGTFSTHAAEVLALVLILGYASEEVAAAWLFSMAGLEVVVASL